MEKKKVPCIITEYVEGQNLHEFISYHTSSNSPIPFAKKLNFTIQIASALHFLHSSAPPIIHRDLTSKNIFVCSYLLLFPSPFSLSSFPFSFSSLPLSLSSPISPFSSSFLFNYFFASLPPLSFSPLLPLLESPTIIGASWVHALFPPNIIIFLLLPFTLAPPPFFHSPLPLSSPFPPSPPLPFPFPLIPLSLSPFLSLLLPLFSSSPSLPFPSYLLKNANKKEEKGNKRRENQNRRFWDGKTTFIYLHGSRNLQQALLHNLCRYLQFWISFIFYHDFHPSFPQNGRRRSCFPRCKGKHSSRFP